MLRKAFLVLSGNAATSLLTLARNLLVARMIPVEDFGIAATLAIAVSVVEMASALGLQQQIVQARDGDDPRFQAALQGFQLLRGVISGAVLFALAGPIAAFMTVPEATWGFQAMALLPVLNALVHFDIHRLSRGMEFRPMVVATVGPAALSLAAAWPLARWLGDWRAMLWAILIQALLAAVASHLVARQPYRLALNHAQMGRSLRFGWPLLVNNVLLFLVFNGDRVIVGRELGMVALGIFSMGVTLTLTPTLVLAKSAQNLFLPRLSRIDRAAPGGEAEFGRMAQLATEAVFAMSLTFLLGALLVGPFLVDLLLGDRYAALAPLLVLLAAVQVIRVAKAAPAIVALAAGRTGNAMIANLVRVATLPLAWFATWQGWGLEALLWIAVAGEIGGYVVASLLVRRNVPGWLQATLRPHLGLGLFLALALIWGSTGQAANTPSGWAWALLLGALAVAVWSLRALGRHLLRSK